MNLAEGTSKCVCLRVAIFLLRREFLFSDFFLVFVGDIGASLERAMLAIGIRISEWVAFCLIRLSRYVRTRL